MGSDHVPAGYVRKDDGMVPELYLRLAKIPPKTEGFGDKGFEKTDRYYPYFCRIRTPRVLRERDVKQYDTVELADKRLMCTGRYTAEVVFSNTIHVDILKDNVSYENIKLLPYAVEIGLAHSNNRKPLRKPGRNSGLPNDYWLSSDQEDDESAHDDDDDDGDENGIDDDGESLNEEAINVDK
jgi:hypothetical protein